MGLCRGLPGVMGREPSVCWLALNGAARVHLGPCLQDEREAQEETGGLTVRNGVESKAGALQALCPRLARRAEGPLMVSTGPSSPKSLRRGLVDGRRDLIKTLGNYLVTSPTTLTT